MCQMTYLHQCSKQYSTESVCSNELYSYGMINDTYLFTSGVGFKRLICSKKLNLLNNKSICKGYIIYNVYNPLGSIYYHDQCIRQFIFIDLIKYTISDKAVGTNLGLGGGQKKFCAAIVFLITLFFQKDTILFISISVISNIH